MVAPALRTTPGTQETPEILTVGRERTRPVQQGWDRSWLYAYCDIYEISVKSEGGELYFEGKGNVYTQEVLPSRLLRFPNFTQGESPSSPQQGGILGNLRDAVLRDWDLQCATAWPFAETPVQAPGELSLMWSCICTLRSGEMKMRGN